MSPAHLPATRDDLQTHRPCNPLNSQPEMFPSTSESGKEMGQFTQASKPLKLRILELSISEQQLIKLVPLRNSI